MCKRVSRGIKTVIFNGDHQMTYSEISLTGEAGSLFSSEMIMTVGITSRIWKTYRNSISKNNAIKFAKLCFIFMH